MKLLQDIRNAASKVISNVTSNISNTVSNLDRDKQMPGFQLAQGGLGNKISRLPSTPIPQPLQKPVSNFVDFSNKLQESPLGIPGKLLTGNYGKDNNALQTMVTRPAAESVLSISDILGGEKTMDVNDPFGQAFFGKTPLKSHFEQARTGGKDFLTEMGTSPETADKLVPFMGLVGLGLDVAPPGVDDALKAGGKKILPKVLTKIDDIIDVAKVANNADDVAGLLTRPTSTTFKEAKNLLKKGDTLDDILEVGVKNADEARQAVNLGIPANKVKVGNVDDIFADTGTMYGTKHGDVLTSLPENQKAFDFAQDAKNTNLDVGNKFTNFTRKVFLDTKDNLKQTFGSLYDSHLKPVMDTFTQRMADGARWTQDYYKKLEGLNIKPGSKDDKLIRLFKDKDGFAKVSSQVGQEKAIQLQEAYKSLRQSYDEIFDFINTQRKNAGLEEIPYKEDFLSQVNIKGKNIFEATLEGGIQATEAISKTISKKQGNKATNGAIEAMRDYLAYAQRAGFTDLTAKEIDEFGIALSKNKGVPEEALQQLQSIKNNILGIKDKQPFLEGVTKVIDTLSGAKVLGKASTLLNQFLSLPQGMAATGRSFFKGISSKEANQALAKSNFRAAIKNRPPKSLRSSGIYKQSKGFLGDALANGQEFSNDLIFKGFFEQARKAGKSFDEAVKVADELTPKIVGDRRLGMSPEVYNSYFGNIFGRFTIEPTAATTRLVKSIGEKRGKEVIGTLIAWHLTNDILEDEVYGYRPFSVDPVEWVTDFMENYEGTDKKEKSAVKAYAGLFANALSTVPIAQNVFNTGYSLGETTGVLPDSRDVFGSNDQTWMNVGSLLNPVDNISRPITGNKIADAGLNVTSNIVPGVEQLLKITQAGQSLDRGYAETKSGDPMYQMPDKPVDQIRALLFGQSATNEAKDWFDNDFAPWLTDNQKKTLDKLPEDQKLNYLENTQSRNENINKMRSTKEGLSGQTDGVPTDFNQSVDSLFQKPTSKAEEKENSSLFYEMLASGQTPSDKDIQTVLFKNKSATSKSIEDRKEVFNQIASIMEDEYLSDSQKQTILKASGTNQNQAEFYTYARKTNDEKLQELLPSLGDLSKPEDFNSLVLMRAKIAGSQGLTSGMIDYLYESDQIDKNQQTLLKAIEFDEITQKFYIKKSSKYGSSGSGSSSKKMTYSQLLKLFSVNIGDINKAMSQGMSAYNTPFKDPGLIENILNSKV